MQHSDFVHLHLHTQYSLLDGACFLEEIAQKANEYKMPGVAITDHGNMFGAIEFYLQMQKSGIKPIIGCEIYVAPGSRFDKQAKLGEDTANHLILLAKDEEGYKNLMKLVSIGYLEGFYYRPRIDREVLSLYSNGLLGFSACLHGQIATLIGQRRMQEARKVADEFKSILGEGNFYLEIQRNSIPEQEAVNPGLLEVSKDLAIPLVATNDVHYIAKDNARAHEALLCIQTQNTLDDPKHMKMQSDEFYFKSPQEMKELFKDLPEAIKNTIVITEKCNLELEFGKPHLPRYDPPSEKSREEFLKELCEQNLKNRYKNVTPEISKRMEHELNIIKQMGYTSYFLIVWDFIHYAKQSGIPVGPGRGSAAGSIVSYLLGITDIDPLRYGLLFERFLNPERLGLPDIDIDFCYERRPEVIEYVTNKYGKDNVAQIITFGTMQARAAIRDVGRVMGMSYGDVDRIAKLVPPDPNITLKEALDTEPDIKSAYTNDPQVKTLIDTALNLEGLNRHASVHAAGVVIADKPLTEYVPLFKTSDDQITTGYAMGSLEKIGLLKMDFLGLRNLTVLSQTVKLIEKTKGIKIQLEDLTLDDKATFKLLSEAKSIGVFQLESSGMRDLLKKLQPTKFEDIVALLALYRPGPIGSGMLDDFIRRKHGQIPVRYDDKRLEPILKETYGIMVYQEQVMRIASDIAGFSLAQADLLRRAMSKKIPEVMERQRKIFVEGCVKNKINPDTSNKIFDLVEYFSGYGFNKSHSAAYAMTSYRTAYFKAHFPTEFMAALLTSERENTDKVVQYVNETERMGIEILPPDVNESFADFRVVDDKKIRFGLLAVKNVGSTAIDSIVQAREKFGKFTNIFEFCEQIDSRLVNKKVVESLIKCSAFDSLGLHRSQLMSILEMALSLGSKVQKEKSAGQISFFDITASNNSFKKNDFQIPDIKEWPEPQVLGFEKDVLGFYLTGHPLARYEKQIRKFTKVSSSHLVNLRESEDVAICGLIAKIKHLLTRSKGERMAVIKLEDLEGDVEVVVFPGVFKEVANQILPNAVVMVRGKVNLKEDRPKILANEIVPIEEVAKSILSISIDLSTHKEGVLAILKEMLISHPGKTPVFLKMHGPANRKIQIQVGDDLFVSPSQELFESIEGLVGEENISVKL